MWISKTLLFISLFGFLNSLSGPKDFGIKVHRHIFEVTEIGQDGSDDNGEMVAQVKVTLEPSGNF